MSIESVYFTVDNLDGKEDAKLLKRELDTLPGVVSVSVNPMEAKLAIDFDNTGTKLESIEKKLKELKFEVTDVSENNRLV